MLDQKLKKNIQTNNSTNIKQNDQLVAINQNNIAMNKSEQPSNRVITFLRGLKNKLCCNNSESASNKACIYDKSNEQVSSVAKIADPIYYELENFNSQNTHIYDEPYQKKY